MRISIKNIGKIKEADVNLNGITLIAGKNDTGKSTVGKVLFSIFNGLHDIKKKMNDEKKEAIERIIEGLLYDTGYMEKEKELSEISNKRDMITKEILNIDIEIDKNNIGKYIKEILENSNIKTEVMREERILDNIYKILSITREQAVKAIIGRVFGKEFDWQINNIFYDNIGQIKLVIKSDEINFIIKDNNIIDTINWFDLIKEVVYLDNTFTLDENKVTNYLTEARRSVPHKSSLIENILSPKENNIYDELRIKNSIEIMMNKINEVCSGDLNVSNNNTIAYRIKGTNKELSPKNLSAGLKTFAILKKLLLNGSIEENGTIILDEPEIHLHPEWQLVFAELIVLMQKEFNLHVLLTTHSPYFLNAIDVYSAKYDIIDKCNYYLAVNNGDNANIKEVTDDLEKIYSQLAKPLQDLEDEGY